MGLQLVLHAFRTVLGNLKQALTISIVPYGLILILSIFVGSTGTGAFMDAGAAFGAFIVFIVSIIAFGYIAASWHRYVLLEETPQVFGGPAVERALPYIGNSILLGLWLMLFLIPIMLVFGFVLAPILGLGGDVDLAADGTLGAAQASPIGALIAQIVLSAIFATIALVYSLVLPASALGESMTFRASREATMPIVVQIFIVAVTLAVINGVLSYILLQIALGGMFIIYLVLSLILQWFTMMVGISILTTLYGHLIEKRDLPT